MVHVRARIKTSIYAHDSCVKHKLITKTKIYYQSPLPICTCAERCLQYKKK